MTEKNPTEKNREQAQHLYVARELHPGEVEASGYEPEFSFDESQYIPNDLDRPVLQDNLDTACEFPYETEAIAEPTPVADFSAYYRRDAGMPQAAEPAFAPPQKLELPNFYAEAWPAEQPIDLPPMVQGNIYRPREVTWASTARREVIAADEGMGYHVEEDAVREQPRKRRRRRHLLRRVLTLFIILALLGAGGYLFRAQISKLFLTLTGSTEGTANSFTALTTPAPAKGYDAAPSIQLVPQARVAIGQICGTLTLETTAVTEAHVLARNLRADGLYDYYLFSADEGKLLCYFEGLGERDMFAQADHNFYVNQAPYLVNVNGAALIRMEGLEKTYFDTFSLKPLFGSWAVIESNTDGSANYINTNGQLLSTLWFTRTFPFTGKHTVAYVDTGSTVDAQTRYLLYVLDEQGEMTKWKTASDPNDVVGSACDLAYLASGELYRLDNIDTPFLQTDEVHVYLDCDAMVARDPQSGKYGLFVHGEQHYDFEYDSIKPVACDIVWGEKTTSGAGGSYTLHAVEGASYPQPLSLYFELMKDGQEEYVALSTTAAHPFSLDFGF